MKQFQKTAMALWLLLWLGAAAPGAAWALSCGDLLTPVGQAVAIELDVKGVLVAGLAEVESAGGVVRPAGEAGICPGDRIVGMNGKEIDSGETFLTEIAGLDGSEVTLAVERRGETLTVSVAPAAGLDGCWYLGLWLRDSVSGIGTVTFQEPESGLFGALGHGVCTGEESELTPICGGAVAPAEITQVVRGEKGAPGELVGVPESGGMLGNVFANTGAGIFGTSAPIPGLTPLPAARDEEIVSGPATIFTTVDGSGPQEFSVEITRVLHSGEDLRQLALTVTDERLLAVTGGIVQGMSGSPILQNGRLVGAVTHVLVEDPTRGYGVTIGSMLSLADTATRDRAAA